MRSRGRKSNTRSSAWTSQARRPTAVAVAAALSLGFGASARAASITAASPDVRTDVPASLTASGSADAISYLYAFVEKDSPRCAASQAEQRARRDHLQYVFEYREVPAGGFAESYAFTAESAGNYLA
jgi:hypothetical protein